MSHEESRDVLYLSENVGEGSVQLAGGNGAPSLNEERFQLRDDGRTSHSVEATNEARTNEDERKVAISRPKKDAEDTASKSVPNVDTEVSFTSTEELHEKFPIYSGNLLDIWQSNNERRTSQSKKNVPVENVTYSTRGEEACSNLKESVQCRRASSDYLNSKVLNENLKLLQTKHEESRINKEFDCAEKLLHIKQLYGQSSDGGKVTSSASEGSTPGISLGNTFTNLIQGCNYFENKRLIHAAYFRKTDYTDCFNQPGAFINESDPDSLTSFDTNISSNGNKTLENSGETCEHPVHKCKYEGADNQNVSVHSKEYVDEFKISISQNKLSDLTGDGEQTEEQIRRNKTSQGEVLSKSQQLQPKFDLTAAGTSKDELDIQSTDDFDSGINESADELLTKEELLESLQLSQSREEFHECVGDRPDCLFHLTNDGSQGFHNIRLRVMLPTLNKGKLR